VPAAGRQAQQQQQRQQRAIRGMAGRCRIAGTPQVRPCRLGRGIHAADTPQSDTDPPPTISRCCWAAVGRCRPWSTRRSTPCVDALRSIVEIFDSDGDSSTHGVDPSDRRNLSEVGRCRSAGCQPHGCGCQAYKDVLAASPHSDTAPPSHAMPLLLLLRPLLEASAGAGRSPADPPYSSTGKSSIGFSTS